MKLKEKKRIMPFDFGLFIRLTYKSLFTAKGTHYRLTRKRIIFLLVFYFLFYIPLEIITWICFLLDEIFFPGYRKQEIKDPVFIIGNLRSGTTFIHRLMEKDESYTSLRTWEIVFAPSVIQRKIVWMLADLDRRLGSPLQKQLDMWEKRFVGPIETHKMGLREPEEDEYLFMHIFSSVVGWTFFPMKEELVSYYFYDTQIPHARRQREMAFYKSCLKRHLYAHGGTKHILTKNPSFSAKIDSLSNVFPDARFVVMVRNPVNVVPSTLSYVSFGFHLFNDPLEEYPFRDTILDVIRYYYRYPLERLKRAPQNSYKFVKYDDLIRDPEKTITSVYQKIGFDISPQFSQALKAGAERSRSYRSKHSYSLREMGLTQQKLSTLYQSTFRMFNFDATVDENQELTYEVHDLLFVRESRKARKARKVRERQARKAESRKFRFRFKFRPRLRLKPRSEPKLKTGGALRLRPMFKLRPKRKLRLRKSGTYLSNVNL